MNYKKVCRYTLFVALAVGCSGLTACRTFSTSKVTPTPAALSFVNHPRPETSLNFAAFESAGCPPSEYGFRNCTPDSPLYALGCDSIREPSDLLGALEPAHPIVLCQSGLGNLFGMISDLNEAYQNKCDTSPDDICLSIEDIIGDVCTQAYGGVCDKYYEALEAQCIRSPESVCDHVEGIYETRAQVSDALHAELSNSIEHIAVGDYVYNPKGDYFFRSGGLMPVLFRYVIYRDDHFVLIETEAEFREIFAPIETKDEALGYVKAVTGLKDYYGLEFNPRYKYFVDDVIEDTHADAVADGYLVHLYFNDVFGCGPHFTYSVDFHVTPGGYVQQLGMEPVFTNPSEDGRCVD